MSISSSRTTSLAGVLDILSPQRRKEKKERERQEEARSQNSFFDELYKKEYPQTIKAQLNILYHILLEQDYDRFGKLAIYLDEKNKKGSEPISSQAEELIEHFLKVLGRVEELEKNTKNGDEQRFAELEQHFHPLLEAIYEASILGSCDFLEGLSKRNPSGSS